MKNMKKGLSILLALVMLVSMTPVYALNGTDQHSHEHVITDGNATEAVCSCETDDPGYHAPFCELYEAPQTPVCLCAEKCRSESPNDWCEICYFDATGCLGTDTAVAYDSYQLVSGEANQVMAVYESLSGEDKGTRYRVLKAAGSENGRAEICGFSGESTVLTIPSTITLDDKSWNITGIAGEAFRNCSSLTSVSIPESTVNIGKNAFRDCTSLESIGLSSVLSIGDGAFKGTKVRCTTHRLTDNACDVCDFRECTHSFNPYTGKCNNCQEFIAALGYSADMYYTQEEIASGKAFLYGGTITLYDDIALHAGAYFSIPNGTLNLNGFSLTASNGYVIDTSGKLTICNGSDTHKGAINNKTGFCAIQTSGGLCRVTVTGNVFLGGVNNSDEIVHSFSFDNTGSSILDLTGWEKAGSGSFYIKNSTTDLYNSILLPTGLALVYRGTELTPTFSVPASAAITVAECKEHYGGTPSCKGYPCLKCGVWYGETGNHSYDEITHECACGIVEKFKVHTNIDDDAAYEWDVTMDFGSDIGAQLNDSLLSSPDMTPARTGHEFTGEWRFWLDEDCTEAYDGSTMPAREVYIHPVFEPIRYNITWDMSGCEYELYGYDALPETLPYNADSGIWSIDFRISPPAGHEFVGFVDGDGNPLDHSSSDWYKLHLTVSGDMTIKAVIRPKIYTAIWTTGEGDSYEKKFRYGEVITIPDNEFFEDTFRKAGHTLTRWEGFTEGMTMPVDGITFTAVYNINSYLAIWTTGDGDSYEKKFRYGEVITIPDNEFFEDTFRKAGHTLTGWDGFTEGMTMPVDGVTFTAIYDVNFYKVIWDNGDGGSYEKRFKYGEIITTPDNEFFEDTFRKSCYKIAGWVCSAEGYEVDDSMPAQDLTFTAEYVFDKHVGQIECIDNRDGMTHTKEWSCCDEVIGRENHTVDSRQCTGCEAWFAVRLSDGEQDRYYPTLAEAMADPVWSSTDFHSDIGLYFMADVSGDIVTDKNLHIDGGGNTLTGTITAATVSLNSIDIQAGADEAVTVIENGEATIETGVTIDSQKAGFHLGEGARLLYIPESAEESYTVSVEAPPQIGERVEIGSVNGSVSPEDVFATLNSLYVITAMGKDAYLSHIIKSVDIRLGEDPVIDGKATYNSQPIRFILTDVFGNELKRDQDFSVFWDDLSYGSMHHDPVRAGRYAYAITGEKGTIYEALKLLGTLEIEKHSVSSVSFSWTGLPTPQHYTGAAIEAPDVTVSLPGGKTAKADSLFWKAEGSDEWNSGMPTNVGTYILEARYAGDGDINAAASRKELTILPAMPDMIWQDQTVTYTGSPADIEAPTVELLGNDSFTGGIVYAYTGDGSGSGLPTNAGEYKVTASVGAQGNYAAASVDMTLVIEKAPAPAVTFPTAKNRIVYGQPLSDVELSFYSDDYGTFRWLAPDAIANAGTAAYAVDYIPRDIANYDYENISPEIGLWMEERGSVCDVVEITVNKAQPDVTAPTGILATYGDILADVPLPEDDNGVWSWVDDAAKVGSAGQRRHKALFTPADADNYESVTKVVTITVEKVVLTDVRKVVVTAPEALAAAQTKLDKGANYSANIIWYPADAVFDFNTVYTASISLTPGFNYVFDKDAIDGIRADMVAQGWMVFGTEKSLSMQKTFDATRKANLTVTAADQTIVYGGSIDTSAFTGDCEIDGLTVTATLTASTDQATDSGEITVSDIAVTDESGKDVTNTLNITSVPGRLVIAPRAVNTSVIVEETGMVYNGKAHTPAVVVKDGDTVIDASEYSVSYHDNVKAGTATVTVTDKAGGNYAVSGSSTFSIEKAGLTIAADSKFAYVGSYAPVLTYTVTGLATGDKLSGEPTLSYEKTPNMRVEGTTNILVSGADAGGNYNIEYVPGKLTVAIRPVEVAVKMDGITLNDKVYDGQALTYRGEASVTGHNLRFTYTWHNAYGYEVYAPKNAGTYTLRATVSTRGYTGCGEKTVTIEKAAVTVAADDLSINLGEELPELTYTVTGLADSQKLRGQVSITCQADTASTGEYTIAVSGGSVPDRNNYLEEIVYINGTLTVADPNAVEESPAEEPSETPAESEEPAAAVMGQLSPDTGETVNEDGTASTGIVSGADHEGNGRPFPWWILLILAAVGYITYRIKRKKV